MISFKMTIFSQQFDQITKMDILRRLRLALYSLDQPIQLFDQPSSRFNQPSSLLVVSTSISSRRIRLARNDHFLLRKIKGTKSNLFLSKRLFWEFSKYKIKRPRSISLFHQIELDTTLSIISVEIFVLARYHIIDYILQFLLMILELSISVQYI